MRPELEFYEWRPGMYDFYRCHKCGALFTYEEERARLQHMQDTNDEIMYICCTSRKYAPARRPEIKRGRFAKRYLTGNEWLQPNVIRYVAKLVAARAVAPWLEKHAAWLLPPVLWFVRQP